MSGLRGYSGTPVTRITGTDESDSPRFPNRIPIGANEEPSSALRNRRPRKSSRNFVSIPSIANHSGMVRAAWLKSPTLASPSPKGLTPSSSRIRNSIVEAGSAQFKEPVPANSSRSANRTLQSETKPGLFPGSGTAVPSSQACKEGLPTASRRTAARLQRMLSRKRHCFPHHGRRPELETDRLEAGFSWGQAPAKPQGGREKKGPPVCCIQTVPRIAPDARSRHPETRRRKVTTGALWPGCP